MKDLGLVSVITSAYNCAPFIGKTIESIQAQTYPNWELLITDDCSTDDTVAVIERYAKTDRRIKLFKMKRNSGPAVVRNNSISKANGRFIAFCDSDDRWRPEKLERQLRFMTDKDCGLSYTSYECIDEHDNINGYVEAKPKIGFRQILRDNGIGCLTAMYDTEKVGKEFMPLIKKRQDWGLWIKLIRQYGTAYGLREPLSLYRKRSNSVSAKKLELIKYNFKVYHKVVGYNALKSAGLLGFYFMPYYFYKKFRQRREFQKRKKK